MRARQSGVEVRSIDYVPLSQRHGELWHLGPLPQMIQSRPQFGYVGFLVGALDPGKFDAVPFLTQFGVTAGYQTSWAIYVSDYSRYLPPDVTVRRTFWWTYRGSGLGALWLMGIGALLAASAGDAFDTVKSIDAAANGIFDGFRTSSCCSARSA